MNSCKPLVVSLAILFIILASSTKSNAQSSTSAYHSVSRTIESYMSIAMKWSNEDLKEGKKLSKDFSNVDNSQSKEKIANFGKRIYKKYNKDISSLIDNWQKHLTKELPIPKQIKGLEIFDQSKFIDLRFCENLSYTLAAVTMYLGENNKADDAIKLFLLNLRFSQYFAITDCAYPGIMIANHLTKVIINKFIWNIINSGKITKPVLKATIKYLSVFRKCDPDFIMLIKSFYDFKIVCMELFRKDCHIEEKTELPKEIQSFKRYFKAVTYAMSDGFKARPSHEKIDLVIDEIIKEMKLLISKRLDIFKKYQSNILKLIKENDMFYDNDLMLSTKTDENGLPINIGEISVYQYFGKSFLRTFPDPAFTDFYLGRIELKYRIIGTGLLAIAIYKEGSTRGSLKSISDSISKKLPPDIFEDPRKPCRISIKGNTLSAWSVGKYKHQDVNLEKDLVLFSISR